MPKIRILLVDDHAILREGLKSMLSYMEDLEVIGEAQNGCEALTLVEKLQPDIVLMDIAMPQMDGIRATRLIKQRYPSTFVLILSQYSDWQYVKPLLQAGASGFVTKRALSAEMVTAMHVVIKGEIYLHPSVSSVIVNQLIAQPESALHPMAQLTTRENEILQYVVQGLTTNQIGRELHVSAKTVEWHRTNIMSKLNTHSVAELVRVALQYGLVGSNE